MLAAVAVSKRFGGLVAVNGISLTVERGSITGLIGPNGAGKTTLFAAYRGICRPDVGADPVRGSRRHDGAAARAARAWASRAPSRSFSLSQA